MAYIKQNWADMQANEIPVEARHLEHIEEGLANVISRVGEVLEEPITVWHNTTLEVPDDSSYLASSVDKLPLEENKNYKVILTDSTGTEAAYELTLVDVSTVNPQWSGFKLLYQGDAHLGGDFCFALVQDGTFDIDNGYSILAADGKTGMLLFGYTKAIVEKTYSTTEIKRSIAQQDQNYAIASQTDFECEDSASPNYLKNKPFGKYEEILPYTIFKPDFSSDSVFIVDPELHIELDPDINYTLQIPNALDPNIIEEEAPLLYTTIAGYIAANDPEGVSGLPESLMDCPLLTLEDSTIILAVGVDMLNLTAIPGVSYYNFDGYSVDNSDWAYRIEGIKSTKTSYKKISSEYTEAADFFEQDPNSGAYIKNLPLKIHLTENDVLFESDAVEFSDGFATDSELIANFIPIVDHNYSVKIGSSLYQGIGTSVEIADGVRMPAISWGSNYILIFDRDEVLNQNITTEDDADDMHLKMIFVLSNKLSTTTSVKITGTKATYTKLTSKYVPAVKTLFGQNDPNIRVDYIDNNYYISSKRDSSGGAINVPTDLGQLKFSGPNLFNPSSQQLMTLADKGDLSESHSLISYCIASEDYDRVSTNWHYSGSSIPITACRLNSKGFYLFAIPSVPKVFKLDQNGCNVFKDVSEYEAVWKKFFSDNCKGNSTIKMFCTSTTESGSRFSSIIIRYWTSGAVEGSQLKISFDGSFSDNADDSSYNANRPATVTIDTFQVQETDAEYSSSHIYMNNTELTGALKYTSTEYSSALLNSNDWSLYSQTDESTFGHIANGDASCTDLSTCTAVAGYDAGSGNALVDGFTVCYRYLDSAGVEHWKTDDIANSETLGTSNNIAHSNYLAIGQSISNEILGIYAPRIVYTAVTSENNLIFRHPTNGSILATFPIIGSLPTLTLGKRISQVYLLHAKDCFYCVDNRVIQASMGTSITQIYKLTFNGDHFISSRLSELDAYSSDRYLCALPLILGNYLVLPLRDSRIVTEKCFSNITLMPLYSTVQEELASTQSDLKALRKKSLATEINGASSDDEIPTAKSVFELVYPDRASDDWLTIRQAVREGLGPFYYPEGYEFITHDSVNNQDITWVVRAHNHHQAADDSLIHTMTLESKYTISDSSGASIKVPFDAESKILYYATEELPAGAYYIIRSGGSSKRYFTLTKNLPAGGRIEADSSTSYSTYSTLESTEALETVTVSTTTISGATSLGTRYSGATADRNKINHDKVMTQGSNNYAQSAIRQWLNSSGDAGNWWTRQTPFDGAPEEAITLAGFLKGLPEDFVAAVQPAIITCISPVSRFLTNSLDGTEFNDEKSPYNVSDKFFLLSLSEITDTEFNDGTTLNYYKGSSQTDKIKNQKFDLLNVGSPVWSRSPEHNTQHCYVEISYATSTTQARCYPIEKRAVTPACIIA
jgi:hypothetical protein